MMVTVIAAPVYVDAATVSACELGQRETGRIGCEKREVKKCQLFIYTHKGKARGTKRLRTHRTSPVHRSDRRSRRPGRMSRRGGCSDRWHRGTGSVGMSELEPSHTS